MGQYNLQLEKPTPIDARRVGNTTRLVDYYIQVLFAEGTVKVEDHYDVPQRGNMSHILRVMTQRLQNEHRMDNRLFSVDINKGIITLINLKG